MFTRLNYLELLNYTGTRVDDRVVVADKTPLLSEDGN